MTPSGGEPLLQVRVRAEPDIFVARKLGREVARAVGLERQDQTRFATALSEIGRVLLAAGGAADIAFLPDGANPPTLWVVMVSPAAAPDAVTQGTAPVRRLVDSLEVSDARFGTVVRLSRRLPTQAPPLTRKRLDEIRDELAHLAPGSPLEELADQNEQLIAALDEVRAQRDELARLNAELEETNRGVMALYHQLSDELEETNRGVVALYGELDEKSVQLRAASEAKSRFLANVSHELRAPVTAIIGLGRLLTDSASDPLTEEQSRQVELIRGSATDLLTLVNDLLDLAKAEAGRIEPEISDVDLKVVFGELRGTLRALATRPEVELIVEDPDPVTLRTDEVLLARVLRNLMTNALKFTERGSVRLSARGSVFTVADTGVGIPEELQERIFEEFYQVPSGVTARGTGTGLGLPYARRLVTILGGTLTLQSTPGVGSTFTVTLPEA
ncbi:ATP-binding protein [Spirilliplanes yamanashiensis]|uniref:histidine kinase n=1 Tax=Spirilliplanes yamanashiensis TaxID=42233 RepID=A0A8J3YEZ1_9ACTN|nr:sensor histidine kinase [Spirilliplanes yamanashiensis]MDP9815287.1 signal transduction histidine kinase [Spirilliplanes yamanashiensis]GIJ06443.1 sensor histidine kinase [Spirilliplanes yamanashiensis]